MKRKILPIMLTLFLILSLVGPVSSASRGKSDQMKDPDINGYTAFKIELNEIKSGEVNTIYSGSKELNVKIILSEDKTSFTWSGASMLVGYIYVKGGNNGGTLYTYNPAKNSDSNPLTPPEMNNNENIIIPQISHIVFYCPNESPLGSIKITKIINNGSNQSGIGFSDITFTLKEGSTVIDTKTPGNNGIAEFNNLTPGNYRITEKIVHNGNEYTNNYTAEVTSDTPPTSLANKTFVVAAGQITEATITNTFKEPPKGSLKITKIIKGGEAKLTDVTFILKQGGNEISRKTLGSDGIAQFTGLEPGRYTLSEIIGDNNKYGNDYNAEVTIGSKTTSLTDGVFVVEADKVTEATVTNTFKEVPPPPKGSIKIEKTISGGNAKLTDITFILWQNGNEIARKSITPQDIQNNKATVIFDKLAPGSYTISEIISDGENVFTNDYEAVVTNGPVPTHLAGKIFVVASGQVTEVTITNTFREVPPPPKGSIKVIKIINGGNAKLTDVTFILKQGGNEISRKTLGSDGIAEFKNLEPGSYTICEIIVHGEKVCTNDYKAEVTSDTPSTPLADKVFAVVSGKVTEATVTNTYQETLDPNLKITKSDGDVIVKVGDEVEYTIVVKNNGTAASNGTKVYETLPEYTSFVAAKNAGWNLENGKYVYNLGTMNPGESREIKFVVKVESLPPSGEIVNNAEVKGSGNDTDLSDNKATEETPVEDMVPGGPTNPPDLPKTASPFDMEVIGGSLGILLYGAGIIIKRRKK